MKTILIATRNKHKVDEIRGILGTGFTYLTLATFPHAPEVVEDRPDFAGNALKKAVTLATWIAATAPPDRPDFVLADDSGLEVDALGGAPGVNSARYAAIDSGLMWPGNSPDSENNAKLLRLLKDVPPEKRTGRFRCVIAFTHVPEVIPSSISPVCDANEAELGARTFDGACEGRILESPRGGHGFGYDPLFVPDGYSESFAELGEEIKNQISHRSNALRKLKADLD